jgi:hypothetical protein
MKTSLWCALLPDLFRWLAYALAVLVALVVLPCALGLVPSSVVVELDRLGAASRSRLVRLLLCSNIGNACRGAERGSTFYKHLLRSLLRDPSFVHCLPGAVQVAAVAALAFYLLGEACR